MAYIIGLFLILAVIFSSISGDSHLFKDLLGQVKDKITATIFPKTEKEIIIDNLNSNYQFLDKFFSETVPVILNSKNVSKKDKQAVKKAAETFNSSKKLVSGLSEIEKEEKSPLKTVGNLIEKVLNFTNSSFNLPESSTSNSIDPTSIPPQCRLECSTK